MRASATPRRAGANPMKRTDCLPVALNNVDQATKQREFSAGRHTEAGYSCRSRKHPVKNFEDF
jgi:hypothetical protein